jgi:phosphohistidine phosphatase
MRLFLIRHGVAADRGVAFSDDALRPLTLRGTHLMRQEAEGLLALGVSLDVILTSPLVRARQTAEVLADGLSIRDGVVETKALAPGGNVAALRALLESQPGWQRVALVGHEPDIGELAAGLVGLATPMAFKKGAVCCVDLDPDFAAPTGPGSLRWFATPKMLRQMAGSQASRDPLAPTR